MKKNLFIKIFVITILIILLIDLFYIQVINNNKYMLKLKELTETVYYGTTAPRGRIYDRNGKIIVDNKPKKVIYYKKELGTTTKEEIDIAIEISKLIDIDLGNVKTDIIKNFYLKNTKRDDLITKEELKQYKNRILSSSDIYKLKLERVTEEDIKDVDKKIAYIYYLMNNGYSYSEKIIKDENVTDIEYALVAEKVGKIKGIGVKLDWERIYPYKNVMRGILGNVDNIQSETKDYYLSKGYNISDKVGVSYLEYQYDDYLKGKKNKYVRYSNGKYELVEEGYKGNDIYLNIDIELQKEVEDIIISNIIRSKKEPNTNYLNKVFVIITDVKTGGLLAIAGKQLIDGNVYDYSIGNITESYAVGSAIKAASHIVGYNNDALKIGETRFDDCIKIKNTKEKCSIRYLGLLDDLTALKYSSNTFQFRTAIKVAKGSYYYNSPLIIDEAAFDKYRETFKEFGLGNITEIDLPNEKIGLIGTGKDAGLLLDLSIGQYDTYTPIELSQYITTIANNGIRIKPYLLKEVKNNLNEVIYETKRLELNKVKTEDIYINRVKEGLKMVLEYGGTGSGYINHSKNPAGKTGTSQTFLDTNSDGKIDTSTISTTFVGYLPYDDPKVSFAIISPDVAVYSDNEYITFITKRIMNEVANSYFNRY